MKKRIITSSVLQRILIITVSVLVLGGCRGMTSEKPPIHLNPNMDTQAKYTAQRESNFFVDGAAMQTPPEGTVARGQLQENTAYYSGRNEDSSFVTELPFAVNDLTHKRGAERYHIFCAPCHGNDGDGKGKIMEFNYPIPPNNLHEQRIRELPDGALFEVISNGIRNMPSYRQQIPVEDRWNIVAHIRELQRNSSAATLAPNSTSPQQ